MSFTKKINVNDGSGQKFEDNTVGELQFDMKPEVGSFNAVTSDAVARAVAGASGEVPQVTENDNGKVLKAIYDADGPAVEWGEAQGGTTYVSGSSASVSLSADNQVVTNSVDVTSITVGADVKSAIVQWVVDSTTTLPTVTDGTNALKAAVNNPSSLTVGRTVQVSILNGTWVCAEFA